MTLTVAQFVLSQGGTIVAYWNGRGVGYRRADDFWPIEYRPAGEDAVRMEPATTASAGRPTKHEGIRPQWRDDAGAYLPSEEEIARQAREFRRAKGLPE